MTCGRVSPFGHPGITVRLSTPPGLSQIPTSFIGSRCQGIHRTPLKASHHPPTPHRRRARAGMHQHNSRNTALHRGQKPKKKIAHNEGPTTPSAANPPDARVHYTVLKQQPPQAPHPPNGRPRHPGEQIRDRLPQDPTARQPHPPQEGARGRAPAPSRRTPFQHPAPPPTPKKEAAERRGVLRAHPQGPQRPSHPIPTFHPRAPATGHPPAQRAPNPPPHRHRDNHGTRAGKALLRKEVIQPHLPVRLPCYDLVPIASPTFDGSPPQGVGPPASGVTDFRDLTGGVYKARERIHRSVADLRLLATPTSWGRVADPNPN